MIPDRDKVMRGLEACQVEQDGCTTLCKANDCPYNVSSTHCMTDLHKDALALIEEQRDRIKGLLKCASILSDALDEKEDSDA